MCQNCLPGTNLNFSITFATCRVCELIDEDTRNKGVVFCDLCSAYICQDCWTNPIKRGKAAAMNYGIKIENLFTGKKGKEKEKEKSGDE